MNKTEVYTYLCVYDERSPYYVDDDEWEKDRTKKCYCDKCFYSSNKLALEIIKLMKER